MIFECELDQAGMEKICKATYPKKQCKIAHIAAAILLLLALVSLGLKHYTMVPLYLIISAMSEYILYNAKKKRLKVNGSRFLEMGKGANIRYHYHLENDGIRIHNLITDEENKVLYNALERYVEIDEYAVLVTKTNKFIAFHKDDAVKKDIKGFVKSHNALLQI